MTAAVTFGPCWEGGVLPALFVPEVAQQLSSTSGRVAPDGYSWMQAVHWMVGAGCWMPSAGWQGPRELNLTTVRVAQLLSELSPCRPGVEFLMRRLGLSRRSVQYHLRMLRETGLLVYVEIGTRHRGVGARASEFALVIPVQFDLALGVRTVGEGTGRRMVGIAEAGRELMARLGVKASKKWRAARAKKKPVKAAAQASPEAVEQGPDQGVETAVSRVSQGASDASSDHPRCAPMEGGCSTCACAGGYLLPSESKLASGTRDVRAGEERQERGPKPKRRVLNKVGRRHQLAFELVQQVSWLSRAAVPRVAWVARHVADAGWTVSEVIAWLELGAASAHVKRPSAFLAHRLTGAHLIWDTDSKRAQGVLTWRNNLPTAARHTEWKTEWSAPASVRTRNQVHAAALAPEYRTAAEDAGAVTLGEHDRTVGLEEYTPAEIVDMRAAAALVPELVLRTVAERGEAFARLLYTNPVVDRLQRTGRPALAGGPA